MNKLILKFFIQSIKNYVEIELVSQSHNSQNDKDEEDKSSNKIKYVKEEASTPTKSTTKNSFQYEREIFTEWFNKRNDDIDNTSSLF